MFSGGVDHESYEYSNFVSTVDGLMCLYLFVSVENWWSHVDPSVCASKVSRDVKE
jgi:hypothetical protein